MLLEGWEALMWFDEVRGRAQTLYEHVLVDEFQDISPVQYLTTCLPSRTTTMHAATTWR